MKRIFTMLVPMAIGVILAASVFLPLQVNAQSPEKMSYQAIIRNADDNLVTSQAVSIKISIVQDSVDGAVVYVEQHSPSTNTNGLVSLEIGTGSIESGDFATLDWSDGPFFIKTETYLNDGSNYTIAGTSQLLSVPYALHAKTAENLPSGKQTGEMQYWNGSVWVTLPPGDEGQSLKMMDGIPTWQTPGVSEVENPATGKTWMDRNLGASRAALSSTDAASYGDLYQWGRATDGHEIRTSDTTSTLSDSDSPGHGDFITPGSSPYDWRNPQNVNLWQGISGINNPCPSGYRLPTEAEWEAERTSWSSSGAAGAFTSRLKLPMAGTRHRSDGFLYDVGSLGFYWSSTIVFGSNSQCLLIGSSGSNMYASYRAWGGSVRCIKE